MRVVCVLDELQSSCGHAGVGTRRDAFQVVWVELASSSVGALVPVEECTSGLREPRVEDHVLQTSVKLGHGLLAWSGSSGSARREEIGRWRRAPAGVAMV